MKTAEAESESERLANAALFLLMSCATCGGRPKVYIDTYYSVDGGNKWECFSCWPGGRPTKALKQDGTITNL